MIGKPKKGHRRATLDPLAQQLENRKSVMQRVDALVSRARATAAELKKSQENNKVLSAQLGNDEAMINDLNATILHCLGIDHEQLTYRYAGRDFRLTDVAGNVATAARSRASSRWSDAILRLVAASPAIRCP